MNTIRSFWMGWGSLCVAGGGAYYFAKQSINADRAAKMEESRRKKQMIESLEYSNNIPTKSASAGSMGGNSSSNGTPVHTDPSGSPSQETNIEPAPTRHAPATQDQRAFEKSKYESATPYRSPKGDRFS